MTRTFATLFTRLEAVAFTKDVGRIPYHISQIPGWKSIFAYCELSATPPPPWFTSDVETVRLGEVDLDDRRRQFLLCTDFLLDRSSEIDVLNLYTFRWETLLLATLYKTLNPKGVAFLKMDIDQRAIDALLAGGPAIEIHMRGLSKCGIDFVTVETRTAYDQVVKLFERYGVEVRHLPVGFTPTDEPIVISEKREKLLICVGRTGSPQKDNDLLLDAIKAVPPAVREGWCFMWIGADEMGFRERARASLQDDPDLAKQIRFMDHVSNQQELYDWYLRASVLGLSSRWESFALVLTEAAYHGCIPLTTTVGVGPELTEHGRLGFVSAPRDVVSLRKHLQTIMEMDDGLLGPMRLQLHQKVVNMFLWSSITQTAVSQLEEDLRRKET